MRSETEAEARPPQDTYSISPQEYIVCYSPSSPPMLPAYEDRGDWCVWCPACGHLHRHGKSPGRRSPHCLIDGCTGGYYLIPTGRPLPADAEKLDRRGRRRIDRLLDQIHPKWIPLQPIPEWGRPIEDRDAALGMIAVWVHDTCKKQGAEFWDEMHRWDRALPGGAE